MWLFLWRQVVNVSKLTCLQNPKRDEGDLISIDTGDKVSSEPGDKKKLHVFQSTNGPLKTIKSPRLTVDEIGSLHFSNVTMKDSSDEFLYSCSAESFFRNEYKLGNRVFLQVI